MALSRCEISDDVLVLIWKFAREMLTVLDPINVPFIKLLSSLHC